MPFHARHPLPAPFNNFHQFSSTVIHFYPLACTFIYFYLLSSTFILFHSISSSFILLHPFSSSFILYHQSVSLQSIYRRYGLVWKGNPRSCVCVEGKCQGGKILCTLRSPFQFKMFSHEWLERISSYTQNFPLLVVSLYRTFKPGLPPPVSLFLGIGEVWLMSIMSGGKPMAGLSGKAMIKSGKSQRDYSWLYI